MKLFKMHCKISNKVKHVFLKFSSGELKRRDLRISEEKEPTSNAQKLVHRLDDVTFSVRKWQNDFKRDIVRQR